MSTPGDDMPLMYRRILICGKGGSGKSTITALLGNELERRGYPVVLLDADASNPGGLSRLVMGSEKGPRPLISYFGGREKVTCPVDDPSPLRKPLTDEAVWNAQIELEKLPVEYTLREGNKTLLQSGKIEHVLEGCDGPMSKITRDIRFSEPHVMLIDVEAGVEHFGRGVELHVDTVLIVVDPSYESLQVAHRVSALCEDQGIYHVWAVLNAIKNGHVKEMLMQKIRQDEIPLLGVLRYSEQLERLGLEGKKVGTSELPRTLSRMVRDLENSVDVKVYS